MVGHMVFQSYQGEERLQGNGTDEQGREGGKIYDCEKGGSVMRKPGEQWVEEIDGDMHLYMCIGLNDDMSEIIKDLGILNEEGVLAEERTGLFPVIAGLESVKCWLVRLNAGNVTITVIGATKQEAIDAWNRRAR